MDKNPKNMSGVSEFKTLPSSPHRNTWTIEHLNLGNSMISPHEAMELRITRIARYYGWTSFNNFLKDYEVGVVLSDIASEDLLCWLRTGAGRAYLHNAATGLSYGIPPERWNGEDQKLKELLSDGKYRNFFLDLDLSTDMPVDVTMSGIFLIKQKVNAWLRTPPKRFDGGEYLIAMSEEKLADWLESQSPETRQLPFRALQKIAREDHPDHYIPDKMMLRVQQARGYGCRVRGRRPSDKTRNK